MFCCVTETGQPWLLFADLGGAMLKQQGQFNEKAKHVTTCRLFLLVILQHSAEGGQRGSKKGQY